MAGDFDGCDLSLAELADDLAPLPSDRRGKGTLLGQPRRESKRIGKQDEDLKLWLERLLEGHEAAMRSVLHAHQGPLQRHLDEMLFARQEHGIASSNAPECAMSAWQMPGPPAVRGVPKEQKQVGGQTVAMRGTIQLKMEEDEMKRAQEKGTLNEGEKVQPLAASPNAQGSMNVGSRVSSMALGGRSAKMNTGIEVLVKSALFDYAMGMVILANMVCMFVQLEWEGHKGSVFLGLESDDAAEWSGAERIFAILEEIFTIVYLLEFVVRLYFFKLAYFRDTANIMDGIIVLSSTFDAYVLRFIQRDDSSNIGKLIKVCRVVRVLKIMRFLTHFEELRVLMRACHESASAFFWSMLLALLVIIAGAIFMSQLSALFILDLSYSEDLRVFLHQYYGSCSKAAWTMFEITFSGGWPNRTRQTVEEISWLFSIFWSLYVMLIHFALTRLVAAMFLKQTMAVAAADKEHSVMERMKHLTATLSKFFMDADTSHDGFIDIGELDAALGFPDVKKGLERVGMSIPELRYLFGLLADIEGKVDMKTFVEGSLRLKGTARATDAIMLQHEQRKLQRGIVLLGEGLQHLFERLDANTSSGHSCDTCHFKRTMCLTTPRGATL